MEIRTKCPLGSDCEVVKEGYVERCVWYVALQGKHPQSEKIIDEWDCAMAWMPVMLAEVAQTNRGQTQALESFRNEMVKKNNIFLGLMGKRIQQIEEVNK